MITKLMIEIGLRDYDNFTANVAPSQQSNERCLSSLFSRSNMTTNYFVVGTEMEQMGLLPASGICQCEEAPGTHTHAHTRTLCTHTHAHTYTHTHLD